MPQSPPMITWAPGSETFNMRVRICCLKNLRTMPLNQLLRNYGMIMLPLFRGNIILLKEKGGMRVLTASVERSRVPKQQEEIHCKWQIFFSSLLTKPVLPKTNFPPPLLFLVSNFGLIIAQQTSIHVNCFMGRQDTPCAILFQKCILWERGLVKLPQP